jgi:hypothetical protein
MNCKSRFPFKPISRHSSRTELTQVILCPKRLMVIEPRQKKSIQANIYHAGCWNRGDVSLSADIVGTFHFTPEAVHRFDTRWTIVRQVFLNLHASIPFLLRPRPLPFHPMRVKVRGSPSDVGQQ